MAKTGVAQLAQSRLLQVRLDIKHIFPGANHPAKRRKDAHIGDFFLHDFFAGRIPVIARKPRLLNIFGHGHQAAHDVVAGGVTVVPQRCAFQLRRSGQQHATAILRINKVITAPGKKPQRPQRLNNQRLNLRIAQPPPVALIQRVGNIDGVIHPLLDLGAQHGFSAAAPVIQILLDGLDLPQQQGFLFGQCTLTQGSAGAGEICLLRHKKIRPQRQRNQQRNPHHAQQQNAGQPAFGQIFHHAKSSTHVRGHRRAPGWPALRGEGFGAQHAKAGISIGLRSRPRGGVSD